MRANFSMIARSAAPDLSRSRATAVCSDLTESCPVHRCKKTGSGAAARGSLVVVQLNPVVVVYRALVRVARFPNVRVRTGSHFSSEGEDERRRGAVSELQGRLGYSSPLS